MSLCTAFRFLLEPGEVMRLIEVRTHPRVVVVTTWDYEREV